MLRATEWLRLRLIGAVVCILVGGFVATNVISYRNATEILKQSILHNELPLTGSNIYSEIQSDLIRPVFISSVMANDTFVKDWLLNGEQDRDRVVRYLDTIRQKYGVFTSFLISEKTKQYYHFSGESRVVDQNNPDDVWYFRVRRMQAPYEINIDYDQLSNRTVTIFVNYRVLDYNSNFLGVTGVGLNIDSVQHIVERYRTDFQRNVYFVNKTGEVTLTSAGGGTDALASGGNIKYLGGISTIADKILASTEGQFEYARNGETYLLDTRFISELGWYVIVEQRQADAMRGLWYGFVTNLWIGFAIILATALIIAWAISKYHRRLDVMATTDKLTGLSNRQEFDSTLERLLSSRRRTARPFAVLLIDIDHFKQVNDTLGHLRGDEVIRVVANITAGLVRETDLVCRWGGEELIVLTFNCTLDSASGIAETLRNAIASKPVFTPDDGTRVTVSVGVTAYQEADTVDAILSRVDRALYQAKRDGRNCCRVVEVSFPSAPVVEVAHG